MPRGFRNDGQPRQKRNGSGPVTITKHNPSMPEVVVQSRFTINQRFGFVTDRVRMVAQGDQASVIICGPGGLGKSHTVTQSLREQGLKDISLLNEFDIGEHVDTEACFRVIKGYSTAKGLYRALYENRDGVIVFDDCDSVLKDPVSLSLLKAALDSYSKRVISWRADLKDEDLPTTFEFNGRVVFISNMASTQMDQAIITRSLSVDLTMTRQQKVERMRHLLTQRDFLPEHSQQHKQDAMQLIDSLQDSVKEMSLRTLIQCTKIRKSNAGNWRELAEYAIAG